MTAQNCRPWLTDSFKIFTLQVLKLAATISLLAIMAFNWFGYQALSHYLQHQSEERLQVIIDEGSYANEALLELSIPMDLPYATDWKGWENFSGEVEIDGIHYRYVQRKLENGRMYVRCLPNAEKQNILNARDQFFRLAYDLDHPGEQQHKGAPVYISNYLGDYDDHCNALQPPAPIIEREVSLLPYRKTYHPFDGRHALLKPPCQG